MEFKEQLKERRQRDFIATDFIVTTKCELKGEKDEGNYGPNHAYLKIGQVFVKFQQRNC